MSSSNHHKLGDILVHSCNKVLRALLPVIIITRNQPSGASTLDELIQKDSQKLRKQTIVNHNYNLVFPIIGDAVINDWDLQLLCFFIKYCCPLNDPIRTDIDTLKEIRNEICHTANGLINDAYYQHKRDEIRNINTRFLAIINDADLTAAILRESDEIDQGARNVPEAIDTLRIWLGRDKQLRTPIATFSDEQQRIISGLLTILQQTNHQLVNIPGAEIDIVVTGADNIQQADQVSDTLVNIIDPDLQEDPVLCNLTAGQFSAIKHKVHEAMKHLLDTGQVVVRATHGCCIVTVKSTSFKSLLLLWRKIVSGETDIVFEPLREVLCSFVSTNLTLKVVLPECGFLEVVDNLVTQIQEIHRTPKEAEIVGIVERVGQLAVEEEVPTSVLKLKITPYSHRHLETLQEHFSDGSLDKSFEGLTRIFQQELSAPKLNVTAKLQSAGLSVKQKIITETHVEQSSLKHGVEYSSALERTRRLEELLDRIAGNTEEMTAPTESVDPFEQSSLKHSVKSSPEYSSAQKRYRRSRRFSAPTESVDPFEQSSLKHSVKSSPEYSSARKRYRRSRRFSAPTESVDPFEQSSLKHSVKSSLEYSSAQERYIRRLRLEAPTESVDPFEQSSLKHSVKSSPEYSSAQEKYNESRRFAAPTEGIDPFEQSILKHSVKSSSESSSVQRRYFLDRKYPGSTFIELLHGDLEEMTIDTSEHVIVVACRPSSNLLSSRSTESLLKASGEGLQEQCATKYPKGINMGEIAELDGRNKLKNARIYLAALPDRLSAEHTEIKRMLENVVRKNLQKENRWQQRTITFTTLGFGQLGWPEETLADGLVDSTYLFRHLDNIQILVSHKDTSTFKVFERIFDDRLYPLGGADVDVHVNTILHIDAGKDFLEQAGRNINAADVNVLHVACKLNKHGYFWEMFLERVKSADMFISSDKRRNYLPEDNKEAQKKELHVAVGKVICLIPLTIVDQHLSLAAFVLMYIKSGNYQRLLNVGVVHDTGLVKFLQETNTCSQQGALDDMIAKNKEEYLKRYQVHHSGKINLSDVAEMSRNILSSYLIDSRKDSLEQMRIGYTQSRPMTLPLFVNQLKGTILREEFESDLMSILKVLSAVDEREKQAKQWMEQYIQELISKGRISKLFAFMIGDGRVYMYEPRICVCFNQLDVNETKPLAVPCVQVLKLPLGNRTYKQFCDSFEQAVEEA